MLELKSKTMLAQFSFDYGHLSDHNKTNYGNDLRKSLCVTQNRLNHNGKRQTCLFSEMWLYLPEFAGCQYFTSCTWALWRRDSFSFTAEWIVGQLQLKHLMCSIFSSKHCCGFIYQKYQKLYHVVIVHWGLIRRTLRQPQTDRVLKGCQKKKKKKLAWEFHTEW